MRVSQGCWILKVSDGPLPGSVTNPGPPHPPCLPLSLTAIVGTSLPVRQR